MSPEPDYRSLSSPAAPVQVAYSDTESAPTRSVRRLARRARWLRVRAVHGSPRVRGVCDLGPRSVVTVAQRGSVVVGKGVTLAPDLHCYVQGALELSDGVFIGRWASISVLSSLTVGRGVRMGERVSIHDENHTSVGSDYSAAPVILDEFCWIGAGATILAGVTIGARSVVAAGAVVNKSVPPDTTVAGVPARIVAERGLAVPEVRS